MRWNVQEQEIQKNLSLFNMIWDIICKIKLCALTAVILITTNIQKSKMIKYFVDQNIWIFLLKNFCSTPHHIQSWYYYVCASSRCSLEWGTSHWICYLDMQNSLIYFLAHTLRWERGGGFSIVVCSWVLLSRWHDNLL